MRIFTWLDRLRSTLRSNSFLRASQHRRRAQPRNVAALLERLESRIVPATISTNGTTLTIAETAANTVDTLTLSTNGTTTVTINDPNNVLTVNPAIAGSTGSGTNTVTVPLTAFTGGIAVNTVGANDSLTVSLASGNFGRTINYDADGGAGDSLTLSLGGTFTTVTHSPTGANAGSIDITGNSTISYLNLETLTDSLSATNRVFTFSASDDTMTLVDAAGASMTIDSTQSVPVTFANPTGTLTINAGDGTDSVTITSVDAAFRAALTINGDAGTDTVNLNTALTLGSGTSTGNVDVQSETISVTQAITNTAGTVGTVTLNASTLTTAAAADISANGTVALTGTTQFNMEGDVTTTGDNITISGPVNQGANVSITTAGGAVTFNNTVNDDVGASNRDLTISAGAGNVTFNAAVGGTQALNNLNVSGSVISAGNLATATSLSVTNSASSTITGVIGTGSTTLTKAGLGLLALNGANTYTGLTTVSAGTLQLGNASALGTTAGATTISTGAVLDLNGQTIGAEPVTLNGTGISLGGALVNNSGTAASLSGNITLSTNTSIGGSGNATLSGVIDDGGGAGLDLTKVGVGTVTLSGANLYDGVTTISAGTLAINGSVTSNVIVGASGTLNGTGTITGNVSGAGTVAAGNSPGTLTITGNFTPTGTVTFEVNPPAVTAGTDFDRIIVNGSVNLSGASLTFAGTAGAVSANRLVSLISNDAADLTTASSSPAQASVVTINGNTYKIFYNGGDGNDVVLVENTATTTVFVDDNFTQTDGTPITDADLGTTGSQAAIKGITAFATINAALAAVSASGTIIVNGGTYAETVSLTGTRTLEITGPNAAQTVIIDDLTTIAGTPVVIEGSSNLTVGDADSRTLAGVISGSGSFTKQGAGTYTLNGTNTYTGLTTVSAGTLQLGNAIALGTTAGTTTVSSGAVLDLNGQTIGAEAVTLNGTGISLGGALINSGSAASLSGNITLASVSRIGGSGNATYSGTINGGFALTLVGAGTKLFSGVVGGATPLTSITQNDNTGAIQFNENVTVGGGGTSQLGNVTLDGMTFQSGDNVTFGNATSDTLTISGSATTITTTSGFITLVSTTTSNQNLTLNSASTVSLGPTTITGNLVVTASGDITDTGNVSISGTTSLAAGASNDITLNNSDDFGGAVTIVSGRDVILNDTNGIDFGGTSVISRDLTVTAGGPVTDANTASTTISRTATFSGTSITLGEQAGDMFNTAELTFTSAGAVSISENSGITLVGSSTAGSLTLSAAGAIDDATPGDLDVTGTASFTSTSTITLGNNLGNTTHFGSLVFSGTTVDISEDSTMVVSGASTASAGLTLVSANDLTLNATVGVTGNTSLTADAIAGTLTVNAMLTSSGTLTASAKNVSITQAVSASSATITADTINVAATLTANGGITLQPDEDADTIGLGTGAGTFSLSESELTNLASTGTVTIGRATGTGAVEIADSVDGNINLSAETFALVVRSGSINVTALNLGTNAVTLTALTGAITDGGAGVSDVAAGLLTMTAVSGIGSSNALDTNVTTLVASTSAAGNIRVSDVSGLTLGSGGSGIATFSGDIEVTAAGTITVSEVVNARGNGNVTLTASSGDVQINANVLSTAATSGNAGNGLGTLTLDSTVGAITTNGSGTLNASGATGKLNLQAATGAGTSSNRLLTNVAQLAADVSTSGGLFVTETNDLSIATVGSQVGISLNGLTGDLLLSTGVLTVPDNLGQNSIRNSNGVVTLTANDVTLGTGGANVALADAAGAMTIRPLTANREIDLGSNTAGKLSLSSDEMNEIVVGSVTIGRNDASQSGQITVSANVNASGGAVVLRTGAGVTGTAGGITTNNLAIYAAGTVNMTSPNNIGTLAVSDAGQDVTFVEGNGLTVGQTGGIDGITCRNLSITVNAGDLTVETFGVTNEIDASGTVTLTAAANDALFKIVGGANIRGVSGDHVYTADKMNLGGTITATGRIVTLKNAVGADAIRLGASDDSTADALELSEGEINNVTATTLRIGSATAGALTVVSDVSPLNIAILHLISGSSMTGTAGGIGSNLNVALEAGGTINIIDSTTSFNTLAISAAGQDVTIIEADGFTIGDVDGVQGIAGRNISLAATTGNLMVSNGGAANDIAASGTVSLETSADNALLTIATGAVINGTSADHTYTADKIDLQGTIIATGRNVTLKSKTAGDTITLGSTVDNTSNTVLELSDAELDRITADKIIIGSTPADSITVIAAIDPANAANLTLTNGGNGSLFFAGPAPSLTVTGTLTVALNSSGTGGITPGASAIDITANHLDITTGSSGIGSLPSFLKFDAVTLTTFSGGNGTQYLNEVNSVTIATGGLNAGSGTIVLQTGTFTLGGSDRINDATQLMVSGATFAIGAFNETIALLTLKTGTITGTGGVLTSTNTFAVESGSVSAILAGTNGLTKSTTATVTLSAANTYTGATTISAGTLTVTGSLNDATDVSVSLGATYNVAASDTIDGLTGSGSVTLGTNTLTVGGNNETSATFAGVISGSGGNLTKIGSGRQTLSGANTYTGATTINAGSLSVTGSITSSVNVNPTATLTGSGTITGNVSGAGIVAPGDSTQTLTITGNVTQSAASDLNLEVGGATPGTQFDRLIVNGVVTLGGDLNLSLISGFVPSQYESFRIIDNIGGSAIVGIFNGYAEGALIPVAGTQFKISYIGGTGNDVVLTVPIPDILLNSVTTNGSTTVTVQYEIRHSALPIPLTIQFLQSVGAVESLLNAVVISNPSDLIIGTHTLNYALGSEVKLPGAGMPEDTSDYTLRAVADPVNEINEVDVNPLTEDNSLTFVANYLSGKTVYLNAGSLADTVTITYPATKTGNTTLAITGSLNVTYTYLYNDVTQFRIRTHGGNDTVNVVNTANLTNRNLLVLGGDGDDVLSGGMAIDTIKGGAGNDTITGNKGSDSLDGEAGTDRLQESADVNFVLTDTSLTGLGTDTLAGFELIQLTGGAGAKKFTVSGFTGTANLVGGGGGDTIVATKNNNFTLTNSLLTATDGLNVTLTDFNKATLTGGDSNNSFEISTWTGAATLTGGIGTDTITATRNIDMTLSSKSLMAAGYGLVKLVTMESATLTGGAGNNTFTVSGWMGTGQLIGGGGTDTVVALRNSNFTLSNSVLVTADGLNLSLSGISAAKLTGGKGNNSFTVTGWTGTGSLTGGGGTDDLIAILNDDVSLSDSQFIVNNGMSLSISALSTAALTTGLSNQILVTGGWQSTLLDQSGSTSVMNLKRSTGR